MSFIPQLLSTVAVLALLLACGYYCRKKGIIDTVGSKRLSSLILSVGQPMMIISAFCKAEYSRENLTVAWQVTLIGFAMHALIALVAYFICRRTRTDQGKIFEFSLVLANCGFLGFPILDAVLGQGRGSFVGVFYIISFNVCLWTWGMKILGRGRDDIKLTPKKIFLNYGTVPCAIGIVIYLCKPFFTLPEFLTRFCSYLGDLCVPISVLLTGALLATMTLSDTLKNKTIYLHSLLKLLVFPIVACILVKLIGFRSDYILTVTAMVGVPSAAVATMVAELYDIEPGYASQLVGVTSLLSIVSLPLVMGFASWIITL
ncbi:MAG: AEC family transporter [Clostridia bacterium]|nr:AEC family transporter [Clostridia bacterium]